jgi:hypothetical protein
MKQAKKASEKNYDLSEGLTEGIQPVTDAVVDLPGADTKISDDNVDEKDVNNPTISLPSDLNESADPSGSGLSDIGDIAFGNNKPDDETNQFDDLLIDDYEDEKLYRSR